MDQGKVHPISRIFAKAANGENVGKGIELRSIGIPKSTSKSIFRSRHSEQTVSIYNFTITNVSSYRIDHPTELITLPSPPLPPPPITMPQPSDLALLPAADRITAALEAMKYNASLS
jgi:hypothetical protein